LECPKCRAPNPGSSRFCGLCATPLHGSASDGAPSVTTTMDPLGRGLAPGTVVAGKYRLVAEIGRGGMGVVYEADDLTLRRTVALKFLPLEYTDDAEARERFVHEARAASVLDNPHICAIHEIGEGADGRMFIAMALCRGESLRARLKRGPLPAAEALALAAQVADGLAAAHAAGIVHRDVKPGNILVSPEGAARIADFGLAKIAGEARLTRAGRAVGTVAYMSPEQLRGEDVDARTDVWSLGVVLREMLTGSLPFHGADERSLAYAIVNSEPGPLAALPPGAPAGCGRVLEKALAKDPGKRFSSAAEMAAAIAAVRETSGLSGAHRPGTERRGLGPAPRPALVRFGLPALTAAAALFAAAALGLPHKIGARLGLVPGPGEGRRITVFTPAVPAGDAEDRFLSAGLAEHLRRGLDAIARRTRSWVTPEEHIGAYGVREAADARAVLGSNRVVTGTLKRAGANLTVSLEVVDPARLARLSSVPKSDSLANIATWQEDLVLETAAALGLRLAPADRDALAAAGTTVPSAFDAYLRGLGRLESLNAEVDVPGPAAAAAADAAVAALESAVRLDPSFVAAGVDLADACRMKFSVTGDRAWAERAEAQARAVLRSNDGSAFGHRVLAAALRQLGRDGEALAELERSRGLDPRAYDTLIRLGTLHEQMGRPAEAEAAYREALRARPGYWAGHGHLGYFYVVRGEYGKARDRFEAASRLCPGNHYALNNLGACHFKLGDYARATAAFERSNAVKKNADACSNLGVLYYYTGRFGDSVTANENAIALGGTEYGYMVWGNLADAYRFTPGSEARAAETYRKAVALIEKELAGAPGDARMRSSRAVYLAKAGDTARAVPEIERALEALPDDSAVALKAAMVFELAGERGRALAAVRDFVRLKGPMDEVAREPYLAGLRQDPAYADIIAGMAGGRGEARDRR